MRDNTRAGLAFKPGTNAPKGPRPVISMRHAGENGARRCVNVTPAGTFAAERAMQPMTSAWRADGTLLGLMFLADSAFRFPSGYYSVARETPHQCFQHLICF